MTGSRYSMDCRGLENTPMTLRGFNAGTFNYSRMPNIPICECYLKEIPGHTVSIYLTFTGVKRLRKTNFLYLEELAIVNAAKNLAIMTMKSDDSESLDKYRDIIKGFVKSESSVRGGYRRYQANSRKSFGPQVMRIFAGLFDESLDVIINSDDILTYMAPTYTGMRFDVDDGGLCPQKLKEAAESLKRGVHFTANLAGIKEVFKENPDYIRHFDGTRDNRCSQRKVNAFVKKSVKSAYKYMRDEVFHSPLREPVDPYQFDIGLEISPTYGSGSSFLIDMKYAKQRVNEILGDGRFTPMNTTPEEIEPESDTEMDVLDTADQTIFELGELMFPDEIYRLPAFVETLTETVVEEEEPNPTETQDSDDISINAIYYEQKRLGVNTYEKLLSNGIIGGVHSGQPLLRMKEVIQELEFAGGPEPITKRQIGPCRTGMEVVGGQAYDPTSMADFLTKQRKNIDDFAAVPNMMARVLSSNRGNIDNDKTELFTEFAKLIDNLDFFVSDCKDSLINSSQHSARFEFFFISTLKPEECDIIFPTIEFQHFLFVSVHADLVDSVISRLEDNMIPIRGFVHDLTLHGDLERKQPEKLHPCVKTRLVYCCEIVAALIEAKGFQGRIMKAITNQSFSSVETEKEFFHLPEEYKVTLEESFRTCTGVSFGIKPDVLALPKVREYILDLTRFWKPVSKMNIWKPVSKTYFLSYLIKQYSTRYLLPVERFDCFRA